MESMWSSCILCVKQDTDGKYVLVCTSVTYRSIWSRWKYNILMMTLIFTLICAWINGWVNNRESGDLRRNRAHYDVIVMCNMVYKIYTCWMIFKLYSTLVLNHPFTCVTPRRLFKYNMYNFNEITRSDNLPSHAMKLPLCFACTYPWADS